MMVTELYRIMVALRGSVECYKITETHDTEWGGVGRRIDSWIQVAKRLHILEWRSFVCTISVIVKLMTNSYWNSLDLTFVTNPINLPFFSAITFSFVALALPIEAWFVKITSLYPSSCNLVSFGIHDGYNIDQASGPCLNKDVLAKVPSKSKLAIFFEFLTPSDSYINTDSFHFQASVKLLVPEDLEVSFGFLSVSEKESDSPTEFYQKQLYFYFNTFFFQRTRYDHHILGGVRALELEDGKIRLFSFKCSTSRLRNKSLLVAYFIIISWSKNICFPWTNQEEGLVQK